MPHPASYHVTPCLLNQGPSRSVTVILFAVQTVRPQSLDTAVLHSTQLPLNKPMVTILPTFGALGTLHIIEPDTLGFKARP